MKLLTYRYRKGMQFLVGIMTLMREVIGSLVQWSTRALSFRASFGAAVHISHKLFSFRKKLSGAGGTSTRSARLRDSRFRQYITTTPLVNSRNPLMSANFHSCWVPPTLQIGGDAGLNQITSKHVDSFNQNSLSKFNLFKILDRSGVCDKITTAKTYNFQALNANLHLNIFLYIQNIIWKLISCLPDWKHDHFDI